MKVSLNTVKQYTEVDLPVDELVKKINQQLGGVEGVIDLGAKYKDARIVRVVECEKHPNADKLSLCKIDAGDNPLYSKFYISNSNLIQVVCGANNVKAGMWAVWLPPQSIVPSTFGDKEPFELDARQLRGEISNGMLASAKELAIGDDHDGIVEITEADLPANAELTVGANFAQMFGLDDTIIDIENKMFTHRPDLFGQLGVAREIAGIQHKKFTSPEWYRELPQFANAANDLDLKVFNEASDKAPRFMATALKNVEVKPSPLWLKCALVAMGAKPINNIVDITNYIMLLTAQPVHAYDYDKLQGKTLGVRLAKKGEKLTLLNHKAYDLSEDDIVIVDGGGPVGLAGVMGGGDSEVSSETKNIVLEVANFDMYTIRKTSMRHGIFTDAVTRFNKGQSALQNPYVMNLLIEQIKDTIGGAQASPVYDLRETVVSQPKKSFVEVEFINKRLGLDLSKNDIDQLLGNVEFDICTNCDKHADQDIKPRVKYAAPFWRTDIELPEDIVEEVGRLYRFDKLPRELPQRSIKPAVKNLTRTTKRLIRDSLVRSGANEVLTYSFVHENVIKKAEQDPSEAFRLSNALSPDLQYYRLTVLPSLLDKVRMNIKSGYDEFVLFEIGKGHNKKYHAADDEGGLPSESNFVDMVYASKRSRDGAAFYQIRAYVEQMMKDFGREIVCLPIEEDYQYPVTAPFDLSRSAMVHDAETNEFIGMIGELKQSVIKSFKLPNYTAAATLDFAAFEKLAADEQINYQPISKYPSVSQDVSLEVSNDQHYADLYDLVLKTLSQNLDDNYNWSLQPVSIYQGDDKSKKVITMRLIIENYHTTMTDQGVQSFIAQIVETTGNVYGARQK